MSLVCKVIDSLSSILLLFGRFDLFWLQPGHRKNNSGVKADMIASKQRQFTEAIRIMNSSLSQSQFLPASLVTGEVIQILEHLVYLCWSWLCQWDSGPFNLYTPCIYNSFPSQRYLFDHENLFDIPYLSSLKIKSTKPHISLPLFTVCLFTQTCVITLSTHKGEPMPEEYVARTDAFYSQSSPLLHLSDSCCLAFFPIVLSECTHSVVTSLSLCFYL